MKICPKCKKEYDDSWKVCIKCNIELQQTKGSISPLIADELRELKKAHSYLAEKIRTLEEKIGAGLGETVPIAKAAPIPTEGAREIKQTAATESQEQSMESRIGRVWFNRIGMLAIIFGVAYFLKYAFDNNWIGELGRVVLGLLAGVGMIAGGEYAYSKKYKIFAEGLIAGGASILYLSIYAAFNFYHLISAGPAFIFMAIVTLYSVIFAIRYDSPRVISFSIIGGFLTPFLLSSSNVDPYLFMGYLVLLDIGILGISYFKKWGYCNVLALLLTYISYAMWYGGDYKSQYFIGTEIFLTVVFILFSMVAILYNFAHKQLATRNDVGIILINGILYFLANFGLFSQEKISTDILGFLAIGLAVIYMVFSYSAYFRTDKKDRDLILSYLSLTLLFATIAIPIELKSHWVTIALMIESTILVWLGFNIEYKELRKVGLIIAGCALFKLILIDFEYGHFAGMLIFNNRFLSYFVLAACALISASLYRKNNNIIAEGEKPLATSLAIVSAITLLIGFTNEIESYFNHLYKVASAPGSQISLQRTTIWHIKHFSISAMWALYSFILVGIGITRKFRAIRIMALAVFIITIVKVFVFDTFEIAQIWRIMSFIGLGVVLVITSFLYQKHKDRIIGFVQKD